MRRPTIELIRFAAVDNYIRRAFLRFQPFHFLVRQFYKIMMRDREDVGMHPRTRPRDAPRKVEPVTADETKWKNV